MFSKKIKVSERVENGRIAKQKTETVDGEERTLGGEEEKGELSEKEDFV